MCIIIIYIIFNFTVIFQILQLTSHYSKYHNLPIFQENFNSARTSKFPVILTLPYSKNTPTKHNWTSSRSCKACEPNAETDIDRRNELDRTKNIRCVSILGRKIRRGEISIFMGITHLELFWGNEEPLAASSAVIFHILCPLSSSLPFQSLRPFKEIAINLHCFLPKEKATRNRDKRKWGIGDLQYTVKPRKKRNRDLIWNRAR